MIPTLVVIRNGVVDKVIICNDATTLENLFHEESIDRGRPPTQQELDNGYAELEDTTICMSWAEKSGDAQEIWFL